MIDHEFKTTTCHKCQGDGFTLEYPSIDYHMKDKVKKQCDACHGFGVYIFLPPKLRVIVDKDVENNLSKWQAG